MTDKLTGNWMETTKLVDMRGVPFELKDKVARAYTSGYAANLQISEVTRIENGKIYLDNSKVGINYPGRLLVVNKVFD